MLCYRAEGPEAFVARQAAAWDPLLDWARHRYDVHFEPVAGVMHHAQPAATVARLAEAVNARAERASGLAERLAAAEPTTPAVAAPADGDQLSLF